MKYSKRILTLLLVTLFTTALMGQEKEALKVQYGTFNIRYANGDRSNKERCWDARRDRVAQYILNEGLDIVGCQEVLHEQLVDLQKRLPEYDYEGVGRENGKKKGEYAPIFWKKKEWERLKGGTFWLSPTPDKVGSVGWDAALTRIATYALLQHRKTGLKLMCINTHFDHVGHQARIESARLILQKSKEIAGELPLVLTGDFNVGMGDAVYHTITHEPDFPLLDTYMEAAPHKGVFYTFHGFSSKRIEECDKIDYIFASPCIKVLATHILSEDRSKNPLHLSDHNPISALLEISLYPAKQN